MTDSEAILYAIKYGAITYNQVKKYETFNGEFIINYPHESIPNNSLLFMIPCESSKLSNNKLVIRKNVIISGQVNNIDVEYNIIKEKDSNAITTGDIVANRLAIFRLISNNANSVYLVNSPLYNDIQVSNLHVTTSAVFDTVPYVNDKQLVTADLLSALTERVTALEEKIIIGTQDAESALIDSPAGTIFIKIEGE